MIETSKRERLARQLSGQGHLARRGEAAVTVIVSMLVLLISAAFAHCASRTPHSAIANPYLFQGARHDAETGFYYFRNRYYDPRDGRFLQRDPVWDEQNVGGRYTSVGNAPTSKGDPLGLDGGSGWTGRPLWPKPKKFARHTPKLGKPLWPVLPPPASRQDYDPGKHGPMTLEMELRWGTAKLSDLDLSKVSKETAERWVAEGLASPEDFPQYALGPPCAKRWDPMKSKLASKLAELKKRMAIHDSRAEVAAQLEHVSKRIEEIKSQESRYNPGSRAYEAWKLRLRNARNDWNRLYDELEPLERQLGMQDENRVKLQVENLESAIRDICEMQAYEEMQAKGKGLYFGIMDAPEDLDVESSEDPIAP